MKINWLSSSLQYSYDVFHHKPKQEKDTIHNAELKKRKRKPNYVKL